MPNKRIKHGTANSLLGSAPLHILANYHQPLMRALGAIQGINMDLDNQIGNFYRAGIGLVTSSISLAFFALIGFLLLNITAPISVQIIGFIVVLLLLAIWFAKLSYQLIFQTSKQRTRLFSPTSIIVIFSVVGLGVLAGIIFRFVTGDLENGFLSVFILLMLFPLGHFCWQHANNNSGNANGT
tara:strand:- start:76 stop:624 length:549 start_codon:yes stop_codon:yes gene_type:complete